MTIYAFDTITPQQALEIGVMDSVVFTGRPAQSVQVAYNIPIAGPATVTITFAGRSVEFGMNVLEVSERGGLDFQGDSRLLIGGTENDGLVGMAEDDAIYGGAGDDRLIGQGGDDLLQGNAGNDRITGERGHDVIYGGQGDDVIRTGTGITGEAGDFAHGNMGRDTVEGGAGGDTLLGGQGDDQVNGGEGDDFVSGDLGDDVLRGGSGNDTMLGASGNDTLFAGGGRDVLEGGDGADMLVVAGQASADGGDGTDTIVSTAAGRDVLLGGAGVDRFEFIGSASARQADCDEIRDWGRDETLDFDRAVIQPASTDIYREITAADYDSALVEANSLIAQGKALYVAAQVGFGNVVVFADTDGLAGNGAEAAVMLAGRQLSDIDWSNIA